MAGWVCVLVTMVVEESQATMGCGETGEGSPRVHAKRVCPPGPPLLVLPPTTTIMSSQFDEPDRAILRTLVRTVARSFYDHPQIILLDQLIKKDACVPLTLRRRVSTTLTPSFCQHPGRWAGCHGGHDHQGHEQGRWPARLCPSHPHVRASLATHPPLTAETTPEA